MIAHHHMMFAFNACAPERIDTTAAAETRLAVLRARTGICYEIDPSLPIDKPQLDCTRSHM